MLLAAQLFSLVPNFLSMTYTARYLGVVEFGVLSFAIAFTGMFGVFTDLGLGQLCIREIARDKSKTLQYITHVSIVKIVVTLIITGIIVLTINLFGYPAHTVLVIYILTLSLLCGIFSTVLNPIFQAFEIMEYQSLGQIISSLLMLSGVFLIRYYDFGVVGIAILYPMVAVIVTLYSLIIFKRKIMDQYTLHNYRISGIEWKSCIKILKDALPFGVAMIIVIVWHRIDTIFLSIFKGNEVVGWYSAAYRIQPILLFFPQALISALYPVMSRFYKSSKDSLRLLFEISFRYLFMIGVPVGIGITIYAKKIIILVFGIEYVNSTIALQILVWSSVCIFISFPFANLFNSINRQILVTKIAGIAFTLSILLNIGLIPKFGLLGASITMLLTEFITLILNFVWSYKIGYSIIKKDLILLTINVTGSSILMGMILLHFNAIQLIILLPLASLVYIAMLYLTGSINSDDILLFKRILRVEEEK